jgi:hypothetical protein
MVDAWHAWFVLFRNWGCLGHQNATHQEIDRGERPKSYVAANHLIIINAAIKWKMVSGLGGCLGRDMTWAERVRGMFSHQLGWQIKRQKNNQYKIHHGGIMATI